MSATAPRPGPDPGPTPPPKPRAVRRHQPSPQVEDLVDHRRTPSRQLPDPEPLVRNLTQAAIEILAGVRDLEQISRWVEPEAHIALQRVVVLTTRARQAKRQVASLPRFRLGGTLLCHPADGVVEATTTVHYAARSQAVLVRLVGIDGRWRAVKLNVL